MTRAWPSLRRPARRESQTASLEASQGCPLQIQADASSKPCFSCPPPLQRRRARPCGPAVPQDRGARAAAGG